MALFLDPKLHKKVDEKKPAPMAGSRYIPGDAEREVNYTHGGNSKNLNATGQATAAVRHMERDSRIYQAYLDGFTAQEIADIEGMHVSSIYKCVAARREELKAYFLQTLEDKATDRVAALNAIKLAADKYMEMMPDKVVGLLGVKLKAEAQIAQVQGLNTQTVRHIGKVEHEIKMYDFVDNTPTVVEGSGGVVLREGEDNPTLGYIAEPERGAYPERG